MAVIARAQCVIPYTSGMPEDVITNTLYFQDLTTLTLAQLAVGVQPSIDAFYAAIYGSYGKVPWVALPTLWETRWYDLAAPPPRVPFILPLDPGTLPATTSSIPAEVSCVLAFQGDPVAGTPQARRRGRIYLGGIGNGMVAAGAADGPPRFTTVFTTDVAAAAENNLLTPTLPVGRWVVWSPTAGAPALITNGWVDNACDTQRRRGTEATIRSLYS